MGRPHIGEGYCTPLARTRETLAELAGYEIAKLTCMKSLLHDEKTVEGAEIEAAYNILGNVSLAQYMHDDRITASMFTALICFGQTAWAALLRLILASPAKTFIVVGHGVLIESVIMAIHPGTDDILYTSLKECEGVQLTLDEQGICLDTKWFIGNPPSH